LISLLAAELALSAWGSHSEFGNLSDQSVPAGLVLRQEPDEEEEEDEDDSTKARKTMTVVATTRSRVSFL